MKLGQNNARDADTHSLKGAIIHMVRALYPDKPEATAGLQRNSKLTPGFRHPFLGGLLCPVTWIGKTKGKI